MTQLARPDTDPAAPNPKLKAADRLMTVADLSDMLGIPVATLYCWRSRREGPPAYRVGRYVRYRRAAVETWLEGQTDQARLLR